MDYTQYLPSEDRKLDSLLFPHKYEYQMTPFRLPSAEADTTAAPKDATYVELPKNPAEPGIGISISKKKNTKGKKKDNVEYINRASVPALVSDGRGYQSVKGPQMPMTEYETPTKSMDDGLYRFGDDKTNAPTVLAQGEPTVHPSGLKRFFGPTAKEMEYANNGKRWTYELENSFIAPGSKFQDLVMQGVDRENAQAKLDMSSKAGVASTLARSRDLSRIASNYKALISQYINGNWDDPERAYADVLKAAGEMKAAYKMAGGDTSELPPLPPVSGKRSEMQKTKPETAFAAFNTAKNIYNEIKGMYDSGKLDDTEFMDTQGKNIFDSYIVPLSKILKESGAVTSEAEQKRIQYLFMTDESRAYLDKAINDYAKTLKQIMTSSAAYARTQDGRNFAQIMKEAFGTKPDGTLDLDLGNIGAAITTAGTMLGMLKQSGLPTNLASNLEAAKQAYDAALEQSLMSATVSPKTVLYLAELAMKKSAEAVNAFAFRNGRQMADMLTPPPSIYERLNDDGYVATPQTMKAFGFAGPQTLGAQQMRVNVNDNPGSVDANKPNTGTKQSPVSDDVYI